MKHLISPLDLSVRELEEILNLGQAIMKTPEKYSHVCEGKKLATQFQNLFMDQAQGHALVLKQQC